MTAGYKKPHTTMNRVKYGNKVKPVKQPKAKFTLTKPSVLDLKKLYSRLTKAATWERADIYALAIQWYRNALQYVEAYRQFKGTVYSAPVARELLSWQHNLYHLPSSTGDLHILSAIKAAKYVCDANGIKVPSVVPYLQKAKTVVKKFDKKEQSASTRYDKLLTLFMQAYGGSVTLKASVQSTEPRKYENATATMYYSVAHMKELSALYRTKGLLAVVIQEANWVARAENYISLEKQKGRFILSKDGIDRPMSTKETYQAKLEEFVEWAATSKYAPKSLVRRKTKRKSKGEVAAKIAEILMEV